MKEENKQVKQLRIPPKEKVSDETGKVPKASVENAAVSDSKRRVYIGNLIPKAKELHLQQIFIQFGVIENIWIARKPPGFAFINYSNELGAKRAVAECENLSILGQVVKVQLAGQKQKKRKIDSSSAQQSNSKLPDTKQNNKATKKKRQKNA